MTIAGPVAVGTYSLGLTERYTAGGHLELLSSQQTLGFQNDYLIGHFGILSLGGAASHQNRGLGALSSIGLSHSASFLSYGTQATFSSKNYTQIGSYQGGVFPTSTIQAFMGVSLGEQGSLSASFTNLHYAYNWASLYSNVDTLTNPSNPGDYSYTFTTQYGVLLGPTKNY